LHRRRKRLLDAAASARIRRGMIRYCVLVIDLSQAVNEARARSATHFALAIGLRVS
jgi:hypothetical protein